jgi:hypothetical protein
MRGRGATRNGISKALWISGQVRHHARPQTTIASHLLLILALLLQILGSAGQTHFTVIQAATPQAGAVENSTAETIGKAARLAALDAAIGATAVLCVHGDSPTNKQHDPQPCQHDGMCCQNLQASIGILPKETVQWTTWPPLVAILAPAMALFLKASPAFIAARPRGPPASI